MPQLSGKMWGLYFCQSERRLGASCVVFSRLMKRSRGGNKKTCVKIYQSFFSVNEIDHPSNISMKRTVEQLAENSEKKKGPFKELK